MSVSSASKQPLKSARRRMLQQTWNAAVKKMFPRLTPQDWSDVDLAFIADFGQMDGGDLNLSRPSQSLQRTGGDLTATMTTASTPSLFWDDIIQRDHYNNMPLSLHNQRSLKLLLTAAHDLLGVQYAPLLPDIVTLLHLIMPEAYVYATLRTMIRSPRQKYFTTSIEDQAQTLKDFGRFFKTLYPEAAAILEPLNLLSPLALSPIFNRFFVTVFRHEHLLELLNLYMVDNIKLIFRLGVALLSTCILDFGLRIQEIPTHSSNAAAYFLWQAIRSYTRGSEFRLDDLLQRAYSFHDNWFIVASLKGFYEKDLTLYKAWTNVVSTMDRYLSSASLYSFTSVEKGYNREWASKRLACMDGAEELAHILQDVEPVQVLSFLVDSENKPVPCVLAMTSSFRFHITQWLPISMQAYNIQLIFSTSVQGRSLDMLYNCLRGIQESIVLIQVLNTTHVIGMYASHTWSIQPRPFGDGQCFLFRACPNPVCFKWKPLISSSSPSSSSSSSSLTSSKTDAKMQSLSNQFMVAKHDFISMGGNDEGGFGLYIHEDLSKGHSSKAVGFDNEPLVGDSLIDFEIGLIEVYKFVREGDRKARVSFVNGSWSVSPDTN